MNVNGVLSNREIQTEVNCSRIISTNLPFSIFFVITVVITNCTGLCESCFCRTVLQHVLNNFHGLKDLLNLFVLLRTTSCLSGLLPERLAPSSPLKAMRL